MRVWRSHARQVFEELSGDGSRNNERVQEFQVLAGLLGMCGIAGFLTKSDGNYDVSIRAMLSSIIHRGPDDFGIWSDGEMGVVLGHRRLSILDLSPAKHQPMY